MDEFKSNTKIHYGPGALDRLGEIARAGGGTRALVVSDPGLIAAGYPDRAAGILRDAGLAAAVFQDFGENPTDSMAQRGARVALAEGVDLVVGLGGGSS